MHSQYDVIIIGAGVVGCITARWLSRYALRILLIERPPMFVQGQLLPIPQ